MGCQLDLFFNKIGSNYGKISFDDKAITMWSDPFNPHNTRTEEVRTIAEVVSKLREQWTADTSKGGEARFQWLKQYFENLAQKSKTFPEFKFYTTQAEYFKSLNLATPLDNVIKALTARLRA